MSQNLPPLVIGIDLGTTNSAVVVAQDGTPTVIPVNGQPTMPSAVGIDPTGKLIVGQAAKNQAISAPENTVLSIKRIMGTDATAELGGKSYRPEEISALILGELKRAAEDHLGRPVTQAVITVPAFFNERQRLATQDAGSLAGLEVLRIINEPSAAALAYGAGQADASEDETLLVYDLGSGTFDVSVVRVENGIVEVRASHGDIHLGGDDFDEALASLGEQRMRENSSIKVWRKPMPPPSVPASPPYQSPSTPGIGINSAPLWTPSVICYSIWRIERGNQPRPHQRNSHPAQHPVLRSPTPPLRKGGLEWIFRERHSPYSRPNFSVMSSALSASQRFDPVIQGEF